MTIPVVIPSLAGPTLAACLEAVTQLEPPPARALVVLSGPGSGAALPAGVEAIRSRRRLGFAAAVNAGLASAADHPFVAVLNDDALPEPGWLAALLTGISGDGRAGSVQGTVVDADGRRVDGRGIAFDRWGLPVQRDRGADATDEPATPAPVLATSGTAVVYRTAALAGAALESGAVFDERFGSFHEDLDLGLRLRRLGWEAWWRPGARVRHLGSATAARLPWRRAWWILANRWRALAGNLTAASLVAALPGLLRGEVRAIHTLARQDHRAVAVAAAVAAAWPALVARGWLRRSRGPRLASLPEGG